jgi:hypothetical protein
LGSIPSGLLRPTTKPEPEPAEPPEETIAPPDEGDVEEGRGDAQPDGQPAARTRRRSKSAPVGKTRARNLRLSDDVHDRLWLLARQRRTTVSNLANELLDRALPKWEVKRSG